DLLHFRRDTRGIVKLVAAMHDAMTNYIDLRAGSQNTSFPRPKCLHHRFDGALAIVHTDLLLCLTTLRSMYLQRGSPMVPFDFGFPQRRLRIHGKCAPEIEKGALPTAGTSVKNQGPHGLVRPFPIPDLR